MTEAHLLLQVLVVSFDAPAQFRGLREVSEAHVVGQRAQPILRWLLLVLGPFDEEPLLRSLLLERLVAMSGADTLVRKP